MTDTASNREFSPGRRGGRRFSYKCPSCGAELAASVAEEGTTRVCACGQAARVPRHPVGLNMGGSPRIPVAVPVNEIVPGKVEEVMTVGRGAGPVEKPEAGRPAVPQSPATPAPVSAGKAEGEDAVVSPAGETTTDNEGRERTVKPVVPPPTPEARPWRVFWPGALAGVVLGVAGFLAYSGFNYGKGGAVSLSFLRSSLELVLVEWKRAENAHGQIENVLRAERAEFQLANMADMVAMSDQSIARQEKRKAEAIAAIVQAAGRLTDEYKANRTQVAAVLDELKSRAETENRRKDVIGLVRMKDLLEQATSTAPGPAGRDSYIQEKVTQYITENIP